TFLNSDFFKRLINVAPVSRQRTITVNYNFTILNSESCDDSITLYLTKNRKKELHTAISIDDILYRKFEQMEQRINEYAQHLKRTYKNVIQVRRKKGNVWIIEQLVDVQKVDGEGLIITIN
ncbi:MAG: hypothetical protein AABY22_18240, partial [Nanoarchaeota archaeon]